MNSSTKHQTFTLSRNCLLLMLVLMFTIFHGLATQAIAATLMPSKGVLLSIGQDVDSINDYHQSLGIMAGGVTNYIGITSLAGLTANADSGAGRNNIQELANSYPGSALVIGVSMNGVIFDVAAGNYNNNIDILLNTLGSYQQPVYLRWAYEVDGSWNNHSASAIITTFKYVHQRIRDLGYQDQIALVWQVASYCPNPAGQAPLEALWPGDDVVDWVGLSWFSPQDCNYARVNEAAEFARNHNKPLFINESSPQGYKIGELNYSSDLGSGSNKISKTADEIWEEWYQPYFNFISDPDNNVKAITYINANWDEQPRWDPTDGIYGPEGYWGDSRVQANATIKQRWLNKIGTSDFHQAKPELFDILGYSITTNNVAPELSISVPVSLQANGSDITVYAEASDIDGSITSVSLYHNYVPINGSGLSEELGEELISSINIAPFSWTLENLSPGEHQIRVVATDDKESTTVHSDIFYIQDDSENIVRFEAENAMLLGDAQIFSDMDASAGSGVAYIYTNGSGFSLSDLPHSEALVIRYTSELAGTISLYINDQKHSVSFAPTGAWEGNYAYVTLNTSISENSTLTLQFDSGDTAMNVDYIQMSTVIETPPPITDPPISNPPDVTPDKSGSSNGGGSSAIWVLFILLFNLLIKRKEIG